MNPEEREMLKRTLKLSEDNHKMLLRVERRAKRAAIWGFIKLLIVAVPLIVGYLYLQPRIAPVIDRFQDLISLLPH